MLYRKIEAARLLSVSLKPIERELVTGRLNCRRIGHVIRFNKEDLEAYIGGRYMEEWEPLEVPEAPKKGHVIPSGILKSLERELEGIRHGTVTLSIHLREGKPRFVIGRSRSLLYGQEQEEDKTSVKAVK